MTFPLRESRACVRVFGGDLSYPLAVRPIKHDFGHISHSLAIPMNTRPCVLGLDVGKHVRLFHFAICWFFRLFVDCVCIISDLTYAVPDVLTGSTGFGMVLLAYLVKI